MGNDARVAREEIFGPVLVAIPHDGDDDAVGPRQRLASTACPARSTPATPSGPGPWPGACAPGTVSVNGGLWYGGDVPFGGYKQSGVGREMGVLGFEEYTEAKSVAEPA